MRKPSMSFAKQRMTRRRTLHAIALMLLAGPAYAAAPSEPALQRIAKARASLRTLQARFTQVRQLGLLASEVPSTGSMTLVRPDRLRWKLDPPDAITYWVTPAGLTYASESSRGTVDRSQAGPVAALLDDLLIVMGGDLQRLSSRYELKTESLPSGRLKLEAVPKDSAARKKLRRIQAQLASDGITPVSIDIEESDEDRVLITFRDVKLNETVTNLGP